MHKPVKKYARTMLEERFAKYFIEASAKSAPTQFAKCFFSKRGETTTQSEHARACLVQTYNRGNFENCCCCCGCVILLMVEDVWYV